ncbi:unnamed protein product [Mytilus coruscus]|uniref:Uncharacterized protein n=1 Tax=Mytilus coruscus TaxID=42192 RepID=A0A6J8A8Z7_MYTCO|nr:unnamed protein product [Mytilus coruscus]
MQFGMNIDILSFLIDICLYSLNVIFCFEFIVPEMSIFLYHYLCKHVIGTANHVKTIRLMNTVRENLSYDYRQVVITSGSVGEGLEMRGSDVDIMLISKIIKVHVNITYDDLNPTKSYFSLMTEDTKPGFAMLRLISSNNPDMLNSCEQFRGNNYVSNALFKDLYLTECNPVVHGPCVSDIKGSLDVAHCLHSTVWIEPATGWINSSVSSTGNNFSRAIHYSLDFNSKKLKYIHAYYISAVCSKHCQSLYLSKTISNKNQYKEYDTCLSYLLMSINHDIVSGWLMLASFFYKANQYKKSLIISSYALAKCTLEKLFRGTELSVIQRFTVKRDEIRKQGVVHSLKFILVDFVLFATSTLIPMELLIEGNSFELPPVLCAHFLSFVSHYHLHNVRECQSSLLDLQLTIAENYFMGKDTCATAFSYYCLGTALQIIGDNNSAKQAFTKTVKLLHQYPQVIKRLKRLYLTAYL